MTRFFLTTSILLVAVISGCKDKEIALTGLSVSPSLVELVYEEGVLHTQQITVTTIPENATNVGFSWSSADPSVATVSQTGLVTSTGVGTTQISIVAGGRLKNIPVTVLGNNVAKGNPVLYQRELKSGEAYPELLLNNAVCQYTNEGLRITKDVVQLNKFYALADRLVQYHLTFSADAKAVFKSNTGDFIAYVNVPAQSISIASPAKAKTVSFLQADREYIVEVYRTYQQARIKITDASTGQSEELDAVNDGTGGAGQGAVQPGYGVGMQFDYYCFGLESGSSMLVSRIAVLSSKSDLIALLYGDSVTQPEGYFPTKDFPQSWTQLVINRLGGKAISSGRGGCTIAEVLVFIQNELPYLKPKYVMVTIGTNGGNTEANLSQLVEYIISQGSIPILNNIPSNGYGSQVAANYMIEQVRRKYGIKGCQFDLVTSINGDGAQLDQTTMWLEEYDSGIYYVHPNVKGAKQMFDRTLIDIPELYE